MVRKEKDITCRDCGAVFMATRRDALRCPACKKREAQRHANRARPERYKEPGVGKGRYERRIQDLVCQDCRAGFQSRRVDAKRCPECRRVNACERNRLRNANLVNACPDCGGAKHLRAIRCRSCATRARGMVGENNPSWKGGRSQGRDGYVLIRNSDPTSKTRYHREHILVWEAANGPTPKGWHVHHLNGIKDDNRLENLLAMSKSDHHRNHHEPWERRIQHLEARIRELEASSQ